MFLDVLVPVCAWVCQIVCGQCLCLLWFGAREASQALGTLTPPHQYTGTALWGGGIKNDPIRGWQCVLTGTTWWCVFKAHFLSFFFLLLVHHPAWYMLYSVLLTVAVSSRDVTTFLLLYVPFLSASFSCLTWTLQHFASAQTRKDRFTPGTMIRVFSDRNIMCKVSLSACAKVTGKYLDFCSGF